MCCIDLTKTWLPSCFACSLTFFYGKRKDPGFQVQREAIVIVVVLLCWLIE